MAGFGVAGDSKKFVDCKAIWDTGATGTVITNKIAKSLDLLPTGFTETIGNNSKKRVPTYLVDVLLPNNVVIINLNVCEGEFGDGIDVLIGMDIISTGDFLIANAKGKTKWSFCIPPHDDQICLRERTVTKNVLYNKQLKGMSKKQR